MTRPLLFDVNLAFTAALWLNVNPTLKSSVRREGMFRKVEVIKGANSLVQRSQVDDTLIAAIAKLSHVAVSKPSSL